MKFEIIGGLVILPVRFVYSSTIEIAANALIDTGSAGTALDISLVNLEHSRPSKIVELAGVGGNQDVVIQRVDAIQLGSAVVENFDVEFGDVATKFGFNSIVGVDLLDNIGACIDFERKEIRFQEILSVL